MQNVTIKSNAKDSVSQSVGGEAFCKWIEEKNWIEATGIWDTECGEKFHITDGTPIENEFKFCPNCGKNLIE